MEQRFIFQIGTVSLSRTDFSLRRVDYGRDGSSPPSRVVTIRQHISPPRRPSCRVFFLSLARTDFSLRRVDYGRDGSSPSRRVVTIRQHISPPRRPSCRVFFLSLSRTDFSLRRVDLVVTGRQLSQVTSASKTTT